MERNANYTLVGFATLTLFVGLVVFVVWLARFTYGHQYALYDVVFKGPVQGLSQGGDVDFNGIKVGEVSHIGLDPKDATHVVARVRVTSDVPIRTDSIASLEPQGVTGVNYVQISAGTPSLPLLSSTVAAGEVPVIHSRPGVLSALLEGSGNILSETVEALDRVNRLLSDQNIKSLSTTLKDVNAVTDELKARRALFADADQSIKSIDAAAQSIRQLSETSNQLASGDGRRSLKEIADAAEEIKGASADARRLIKELEAPTTEFATTGLPELSRAVVSLQQTAETLNRLSVEAEQSPQSLVSKPPDQEVKVQP